MRLFATGFFGALLFAGSADAQICAPLPDAFYPFSVGQISHTGLAPTWSGAVPPSVLTGSGNPGFSISTVAPPMVPAGMPTALLLIPIGGTGFVPPPMAFYGYTNCGYAPYPFGLPEVPLIPHPTGAPIAIPGPPAPGGSVPLPLPPGLPPGLMGFVVMTVGIDLGSGPCLWATDGIRFGTM